MYKSCLQQLCQQNLWCLPKYATIKDGPDHVPCFTAAVTVNGMTFHTVDSCRSSKEAQNEVAKIAFTHFTRPEGSKDAPPLPLGGCRGSSSSSDELNASAIGGLQQLSSNPESRKNTPIVADDAETGSPRVSEKKLQESTFAKDSRPENSSQHPVKALSIEETIETGGMQLFKNQLQAFALKKNLGLPKYVCHHDGPPHACRFKASVTIAGQTYESHGFLRTVKEAEHAAAKAAFLSLSQGTYEEDAVIYKNILQELCQKEGFSNPVYKTTISGQSHIPIFSSSVEVDGKLYEGVASNTKKKAEMSAAKIAWLELNERKQTVLPSICSIVEQMEWPAVGHAAPLSQSITFLDSNRNMQSKADADLNPEFRSEFPTGGNAGIEQQMIKSSTPTPARNKERIDHSPSPHSENIEVAGVTGEKSDKIYECPPRPFLSQPTPEKEQLEVGESSETRAWKQEGPGSVSPPGQGPEKASPIVKRDDEIYARLRDPFPECETESQSDSSETDQRPQLPSVRGSRSLLCNRIGVYPRAADVKLPPGAIPLPIDDDMWIAVRLEYPDEKNADILNVA